MCPRRQHIEHCPFFTLCRNAPWPRICVPGQRRRHGLPRGREKMIGRLGAGGQSSSLFENSKKKTTKNSGWSTAWTKIAGTTPFAAPRRLTNTHISSFAKCCLMAQFLLGGDLSAKWLLCMPQRKQKVTHSTLHFSTQ